MLQTQSYSTEEIEKGIVLVFDTPGTALPPAEEYFYYFDVASVLPKTPLPTITFDPPSASYSVLADRNFRPKIAMTVKTVHRSECQILCRLTIKNRYNVILYTDYVLVAAIPQNSISFNCTLLPGNIPSNIGPDGGSILVVNDSSSVSLSDIVPGMVVTGPGIPEDSVITVKGFISSAQNRIELSELIPIDNNISRTGIYTFILQTKCVDPILLASRETLPSYIILSHANNWTYTFNDKIIAKFIRENTDDNNIVVLLPTKNLSLLPSNEEFSDLPQSPLIHMVGRVINDSVCVSSV
jgi:hypothetical protein